MEGWALVLVVGAVGLAGVVVGALVTMLGLVAWGSVQVEQSRMANADEGMLGEDLGWERGRGA